MHKVRFRNGLVIIDRHYYDFRVDPRRYRINAPDWAVWLGGVLLPKPDLVFLLDAPTEVLQSRKQEVPVAETERQRNAFLALVKPMKNGHVMDASRPPEAVASSVVQTVLEYLTARTAVRGDCK
jgi:thymidylate kinase